MPGELNRYGWRPALDAAFHDLLRPEWRPARVVAVHRGEWRLVTDDGPLTAIAHPSLRRRAAVGLPAIGDWVAFDPQPSPAVIEAVLPRRSAFVRKEAGDVTREQVVAANVDAVFLISGMDGDFNPRRIERYLTLAWESGADPVVVLTKADLAADPDWYVAEAELVAPAVPVIPVAAPLGDGLDRLEPWLQPGQTVALLGSSGVGKSTLLNALLGEERQATQAVREADSRGRHTTTHREIFLLPGGAAVIDSPGMRELQLWGRGEGLDDTFPEITVLEGQCRFANCAHETEPGCALLEAVDDGRIDPLRLDSWQRLQRELVSLESRRTAAGRAAQEKRWKRVSKAIKEYYKGR